MLKTFISSSKPKDYPFINFTDEQWFMLFQDNNNRVNDPKLSMEEVKNFINETIKTIQKIFREISIDDSFYGYEKLDFDRYYELKKIIKLFYQIRIIPIFKEFYHSFENCQKEGFMKKEKFLQTQHEIINIKDDQKYSLQVIFNSKQILYNFKDNQFVSMDVSVDKNESKKDYNECVKKLSQNRMSLDYSQKVLNSQNEEQKEKLKYDFFESPPKNLFISIINKSYRKKRNDTNSTVQNDMMKYVEMITKERDENRKLKNENEILLKENNELKQNLKEKENEIQVKDYQSNILYTQTTEYFYIIQQFKQNETCYQNIINGLEQQIYQLQMKQNQSSNAYNQQIMIQQFEEQVHQNNQLINENQSLKNEIIELKKQLAQQNQVQHFNEMEEKHLEIQYNMRKEITKLNEENTKLIVENQNQLKIIQMLRKNQYKSLMDNELQYYPFIKQYHLNEMHGKLSDIYILNPSMITQQKIILPIVVLNHSTQEFGISRTLVKLNDFNYETNELFVENIGSEISENYRCNVIVRFKFENSEYEIEEEDY